jgi:pyrimidine deaminase RibD-like protein
MKNADQLTRNKTQSSKLLSMALVLQVVPSIAHISLVFCVQKMIINAGIVRVVFSIPYPDEAGVRMLREADITVEQIINFKPV